jgi:phosphoribosylformimino-5-aminoimidazole carboxamide ribotide isomerase
MNGKVVRLVKGDPDKKKDYDALGDPVQIAEKWEKESADAIHVVDLDAALGRGDNRTIIKDILKKIKIPIQVGGGIRSKEAITEFLHLGVNRVVVGTLAFKKKDLLKQSIENFGREKIIVALDYLSREVMIKGWTISTKITLENAIDMFQDLGAKQFLLTSISKDGVLTGPDYETLEKITKYTDSEIYAAGGISDMKDLIILNKIGLRGVIIGKALYENRVKLKEAINLLKE